ncbi:MAG: tetratricopeptide repeat protein [Candidatus Aquicultor sp.]|nr:tetratricopeptide repeat protein [Candidatus Aquicultor sp.]
MEQSIKKVMVALTILLALSIVAVLGFMLKDVFFEKDIPQNPAEQAYSLAKAMADKDPKNPGYLFELAKAEADLGKTGDAVDHLQKAIKMQPAAPMLHYTLARIYLDSGQEKEAVKELEQELRVTENKNELAWFDLGEIFLKRKDYNQAINCFNMALVRMPAGADVHYSLGKAYEGIGRFDLAMRSYADALKYIPDHTDAQIAIQQLQLKQLEQKTTGTTKK